MGAAPVAGAGRAGSLALCGRAHAQTLDADGRLIYTPGAFDRLEVNGQAVIKLSQGNTDQVIISGDAESQKALLVELNDDRLLISPAGGWKFWHKDRVQIEVVMRHVRAIALAGASELRASEALQVQRLTVQISGAAQLRLDALSGEAVSVQIAGSGEAQLRGQVQELNLRIAGKGRLNAEQLRAERGQLTVNGVATIGVWVEQKLRLDLVGFAKIDYWGTPEFQRNEVGYANRTARGPRRPEGREPGAQGSPSQ